MKTLKFFSRGLSMCFDLEAQAGGILRFLGRKHDSTIGNPGVDMHGKSYMSGGWPSTGQAHEVPARAEYMNACKDGDLWPADQETADFCGVKFDPSFGGEHAVKKSSK